MAKRVTATGLREGPWALPDGWRWDRIDNVAPVNPRRGPDLLADEAEVAFVPMAAVQAETGVIDVSARRPVASVRQGFTRFGPGDVIFAKITPCMENGKIAIVPTIPADSGFGSTEFHVMSPRDVTSRYLYYWVSQRGFRETAEFNMTGTAGQKRVPTDFMRDALIPVPPAAEQNAVVARIEELFAEIDDGEAALTRARNDLATWRKALLKAAVTGELTADWRAANPPTETGADLLHRMLVERRAHWEALPKNRGKRYNSPAEPAPYVGTLPEGWAIASMPQLGDFGRGKSKHRPRNDPKLYGGPYPFVQTGVVSASRGKIVRYDQTYTELGLSQSKLWPAETLCITIAANIAKTGVLQFAACFPDSVVGLSCANGVQPTYVELVIRTLQQGLEDDAPATAQKNINLETLQTLPIPLPSSSEQAAIVTAFEDAEAAGDLLIRDDIDKAAATLRQSILAAAFLGELA